MIVAALDTDQLGQALLAVVIAAGWAGQQYRARKQAEEVKRKAEITAAAVAAQAVAAANAVAVGVDAARNETRAALEQITVLVNGRLDELLAELQAERDRSQRLEEKLGLEPGASIPSSQILTAPDPKPPPEDDLGGNGG